MDFALETDGAYDEVLDAALWAEARGLVALAMPDHYLNSVSPLPGVPAYDAFVHLSALARDTDAIDLAVLVAANTFRHPAVVLKMAVSIDHLSGGRFSLGVGTGWLEREHQVFGLPFPDLATRFAMLEDALGYLAAGLGREAAGYDGRFYTLEPFELAPPPAGALRLIVGGHGMNRTPKLAGRYAGEYNVFPGTADQLAARIGAAREAAAQSGRDFDAIRLSSAGQLLTAPTRGEFEQLFAAKAASLGLETEALEAHFAQRGTPRGSFEEVIDQLGVLSDHGVERFYLQWWAGFDRDLAADFLEHAQATLG